MPLHVISVYLASGIGGLAGKNIDILNWALEEVLALPGPWIAVGVWNMEPSDVQSWAKAAGGLLITSGEATCGDRELDFGICSWLLGAFVEPVVQLRDAPSPPTVPFASP